MKAIGASQARLRGRSSHRSRGTRTGGGVVLVFLVLGAALGLLTGSSARAALYLLAGVALIAIIVWASRLSSVLLGFALPVLGLGLLIPKTGQLVADLAVLVFVLAGTLRAAAVRDRNARVGAACLGVFVLWIILGLNPNVPNLSTVLLGARKTTLVFPFFAAGVLWPRRTVGGAQKLLMTIAIGGGVLCLGVHFLDPSREASFARAANIYTSTFDGKIRLQGIFGGPFHVAMLGTFLILRAWHWSLQDLRRHWSKVVPSVAIGLPLILLADVRTAYLALAIGVLITPVLAGTTGRRNILSIVLPTGALVLVVIALLGSGFASNGAISSIPQVTSSTRDTPRLTGWADGFKYFEGSPIYGLGPGSGGATLQTSFVGHVHVTADNEFVAVLVEGGLVGIIAIAAVWLSVGSRWRAALSPSLPGSAALIALGVFAMTGNAFEASPVSLYLAVLIGWSVRAGDSDLLSAPRNEDRHGSPANQQSVGVLPASSLDHTLR